LGEIDPRAALALATQGKEEGFFIVMHDWLIRDRAAAIAWFHEQPNSEVKSNFSVVAGMVLAASEPELLGQLTSSIDDPEWQRKSLTQSIIAQSITDADAAIARFGELTDSESRKAVLSGLLGIHGTTRPRELLEMALPAVMENPDLQHLTGQLLRNDFAANPAAALEWLDDRTPEEFAELRKGVDGVRIPSVGKLDEATVRASAARMENPTDREWLLANYHAGRAGREPLAALEALSSVSNAALREEGITHVLFGSVRDHREAEVEAWLTAQPADRQTALRSQISRMQQWNATAIKP
jgi:hypothetical protein